MLAMSEIQYFFQLPQNFGDDRSWRSALANFKEHYADMDAPLKLFNVNETFDVLKYNAKLKIFWSYRFWWNLLNQIKTDEHPNTFSAYFKKLTDAFLAAMQKHAGGVSAEQKKNWEELLAKAYGDMKQWGWL